MLKPGLYEQIINDKISRELAKIPTARQETAPIDTAEAAQVELINQMIGLAQNATQEADFAALSVDQRAEQLLALLKENDARLALGKTAGTAPYTFLGIANYVEHQGSRPMSITWKLDTPIPAKYLKKTNKLVAG